MDKTNLKGINVLVTRPEHQAQGLCQALEKSGATPLPFPVLEITDPQDIASAKKIVQQLENYNWLIFISANAVERAFALMKQENVVLPDSCKVAAIGRSTADKLDELKVKEVLIPQQRFDSEGLLAQPELSELTGQKVLIFRGEGGREILGKTLQQQGAEVVHVAVYRRVKPDGNLDKIEKNSVDIAIVTSNQSIQNLWQMAGKKHQRWLKQVALVVMSERNREYARKTGYQGEIIVASQQNDEGLLAAVQQWKNKNRARKSPMADKNSSASIEKNRSLPSKAKQEQPTTVKEKKRSKTGLIAVFIILIILVVAAGIGGYQLWLQQQQVEDRVIQKVDENSNALTTQVEQLKQELSNHLNSRLKNSNQQLETVTSTLEKLQKENRLLWQSLREMEQKSGDDKRPWQLAEAAYLMRLANHRLQLEHDIAGAKTGLESADLILKQVADPALLPVREQLARELTQLKMVDEIDLEGLSAQLMGLAESARNLPIKGIELVELQGIDNSAESASSADEGWQAVASRVWGEMRSLVVITHNDKLVAPLIPADQQSYLYHNVELQLETARMALLKGEQQTWLSSLSYARNWLYDYFDHEMPSVKNSIELIYQLEKVNISPELPDISASLRALQTQREKLIKRSEPVLPIEAEVTL